MRKTTTLIPTLGEKGLVERLNPEERTEGLKGFKEIVLGVETKEYERNPYIGDDFMPDRRFYDAIGAIYPLLTKKQRTEALHVVLRQMDGIRYDRVNHNHTPYIRDPQLLADISSSQTLYWPGLRDEEALWKGRLFNEVREDIMEEDGLFKLDKVNSDFLVAYALLRTDFTDFGERYSKEAHPGFLKRVMKGIVALSFSRVGEDAEKIEVEIKRLKDIMPEVLHEQIEKLRKESDWVYLSRR